jgi:hypothetical protein
VNRLNLLRFLWRTIAVTIFTLMAHMIYRTSRTCTLVAAIDEAEKAYLGAIEAGMLSAFDANTETTLRMSQFVSRPRLQIKVSKSREARLYNSLSTWASFPEYLQGHPLKIVECEWEVWALKAYIEVCFSFFSSGDNPLN